MDGFVCAVCLWVFTLWLAFMLGQNTPLAVVKADCAKDGEVVIQNTVIQCKPVAALVDGKRITFVEK